MSSPIQPTPTPEQIRVLEWLGANSMTAAEWTVNGRTPRSTQGPETWNFLRLTAKHRGRPAEEILIPAGVLSSLRPEWVSGFEITDAGRAAIRLAKEGA